MSYYLGKVLALGFDEFVRRVTEALKREGFGIITEIDVKARARPAPVRPASSVARSFPTTAPH